jgi:hypothetical protein
MRIRLPANATPEQFDAAYAAGMIRKESLEHGKYYGGHCRNASIARWHAGKQIFIHWRKKFNARFLEAIKHPVDEANFDVYIAVEEVAPGSELIPDDQFEQFVK